ncbi:MAG: aminotransferase class I/II-fold pyridoxal phosphate-dependent enzyme [Candidatus Hodarchaeota archaeon]
MRDSVSFLGEEYGELVKKNLEWRMMNLQGPSLPHPIVNGRKMLMLCSNNYLNLSNHPKLKEGALRAIEKYGVGPGAVRPIIGNMEIHKELEGKLANFKGTEASLVYQSGFTVNSGLIPQLMGKGDIIVSDELNHGSIIDGVRLSRADRAVYKHCDAQDLGEVLNEAEKKKYRRVLIITDGVFSMDGDIAPLDEIVKLAREHGAMTYVDDAHGDGVLGENGKGIVHHFRLEGKVDVEMGTFSKAFGAMGGYIAGSEDLRNFALNKSRTFLLTTGLPPALCGACIAALEVIQNEPQWLERLWDNTNYFKKELNELGFNTGDSETPITPIILGESEVTNRFSDQLFREGILGTPIVFPMVARDKARIRTIMNAGLTREDLDFALDAFEKIGKALKVI